MAKYQDLTIYTFETKRPSIMSKLVCVEKSYMTIQSIRCRFTQIYILYFELIKTTSGEVKNTDFDTIGGNKLLPGHPEGMGYLFYSSVDKFHNGQQVLWQG